MESVQPVLDSPAGPVQQVLQATTELHCLGTAESFVKVLHTGALIPLDDMLHGTVAAQFLACQLSQ